jgi:hypothetical protein
MTREALDDLERKRQAEAEWCLTARGVALRATEFLATATHGRSTASYDDEDDAPPQYWHQTALTYLTAMGLRAGRAGIAVISLGYAPEASGLLRLVGEVRDRAKWVNDDPRGERAKAWLTQANTHRRKSGPRALANSAGRQDIFDFYSQSAHTEASGALRLGDEMDDNFRVPINPAPRHGDCKLPNAMLSDLAEDLFALTLEIGRAWQEEIPETDHMRMLLHIDGRLRHGTVAQVMSDRPNPYIPTTSG